MMTRASAALLLLAPLAPLAPLASPGKVPFTTDQLRGFYTERICGTVFTDRCRAASTRTGLRKNGRPGRWMFNLKLCFPAFWINCFGNF